MNYEIHAMYTRRRGTQIGDWEIVPVGSELIRPITPPADLQRGDDRITDREIAIDIAERVRIREHPCLENRIQNEFPDAYDRLVTNAPDNLRAQAEATAKAKHHPSTIDDWDIRYELQKMMEAMPKYQTSNHRAARLFEDRSITPNLDNYVLNDQDYDLRIEVVDVANGSVVHATGPNSPPLTAVPKPNPMPSYSPLWTSCQRILTLEDVGRIPEWEDNGNQPARCEHHRIGQKCNHRTEATFQSGGSRFYCRDCARAYGNNPDRLPVGLWRDLYNELREEWEHEK